MRRIVLTAAVLVATGAAGTAAASPDAATAERLAATVRPPVAEQQRMSLPPGVARTAVERRDGRVTAAAGFLCGREDIRVRDGGAGAYGSDANGRFVGAALRISFR